MTTQPRTRIAAAVLAAAAVISIGAGSAAARAIDSAPATSACGLDWIDVRVTASPEWSADILTVLQTIPDRTGTSVRLVDSTPRSSDGQPGLDIMLGDPVDQPGTVVLGEAYGRDRVVLWRETDPAERQDLVLHELGHVWGLGHTDADPIGVPVADLANCKTR